MLNDSCSIALIRFILKIPITIVISDSDFRFSLNFFSNFRDTKTSFMEASMGDGCAGPEVAPGRVGDGGKIRGGARGCTGRGGSGGEGFDLGGTTPYQTRWNWVCLRKTQCRSPASSSQASSSCMHRTGWLSHSGSG